MLHNELGDKVGVGKNLIGFAGIAMAEGHPERATRLLAAADRLIAAAAGSLTVSDRAEYTMLVESVRSVLGLGPFEAEWASGTSLSLKDAISYAIV